MMMERPSNLTRVIKFLLHSAGVHSPFATDLAKAYDAPFPSSAYKAGARAFPALVPTSPNDPAAPDQAAAWEVLEKWNKPFVCAHSDGDPITRGGDRYLKRRIPGTKGQAHVRLRGGHFIQEDDPQGFSDAILNVMAAED